MSPIATDWFALPIKDCTCPWLGVCIEFVYFVKSRVFKAGFATRIPEHRIMEKDLCPYWLISRVHIFANPGESNILMCFYGEFVSTSLMMAFRVADMQSQN